MGAVERIRREMCNEWETRRRRRERERGLLLITEIEREIERGVLLMGDRRERGRER